LKLVKNDDAFVVVSLSRRNIEGLLAQAEANEGTSEVPQLLKRQGDHLLIVTLQDDVAHYAGERAGSSGPGQVYGERIG
jgi:hypothetical protein